MTFRRAALTACSATVALATVAGCTSSSDGGGTPSATVTTTATVTSAAPPTGSGVPASPTATAATTTTGGGGGNASGPGLCTPTVMTFAVGRDEGAAGTDYFSVTATNASQQSCVTTGFPGVALLDAAGDQVIQADRDSAVPSTTLTVAPGGKVTATIAAASGAADSSKCGTYPAMLFTMPDNTDSTKLTHSVYACAVRVQAFVAGDGS